MTSYLVIYYISDHLRQKLRLFYCLKWFDLNMIYCKFLIKNSEWRFFLISQSLQIFVFEFKSENFAVIIYLKKEIRKHKLATHSLEYCNSITVGETMRGRFFSDFFAHIILSNLPSSVQTMCPTTSILTISPILLFPK